MLIEESLKTALSNLQEVLTSLPHSIAEMVRPADTPELPTPFSTGKFASITIAKFGFDFTELTRQTQLLTEVFSDLGEKVKSFQSPEHSRETSLENFTKKFATIFQPFQVQGENNGISSADLIPAFREGVKDLVPFRSERPTSLSESLGSPLTSQLSPILQAFPVIGLGALASKIASYKVPDVNQVGEQADHITHVALPAPVRGGVPALFQPEVTRFFEHFDHGKLPAIGDNQVIDAEFRVEGVTLLRNSAKDLKNAALHFLGLGSKASGFRETIGGAIGRAGRAFSGGGVGAGGIGGAAASVARAGAVPGAFLAINAEVENLRRQALAAYGSNANLAQFSGALFTGQAQFNLGQFQRMRDLAHATSESGLELAQRVNQMEQAFLPFDTLRKEVSNRVGIVKANIAKGWADVVLTPIVNAANFIGGFLKEGMESDNPLIKGGTIAGGIGIPALTGALAGASFAGPWGAVAGGIAGAVAGGIALDPGKTGNVLGQAVGLGVWGAAAGLWLGGPWGAAAGFAGGAAIGAGKALLWDEDEKVKIQQGPWMQFLRDARNEKPLRPMMRIPERPNRFQVVR